jgi:hypothetical protein
LGDEGHYFSSGSDFPKIKCLIDLKKLISALFSLGQGEFLNDK